MGTLVKKNGNWSLINHIKQSLTLLSKLPVAMKAVFDYFNCQKMNGVATSVFPVISSTRLADCIEVTKVYRSKSDFPDNGEGYDYYTNNTDKPVTALCLGSCMLCEVQISDGTWLPVYSAIGGQLDIQDIHLIFNSAGSIVLMPGDVMRIGHDKLAASFTPNDYGSVRGQVRILPIVEDFGEGI